MLKALGRGLFGEGVDRALSEIEVVRTDGPPSIMLHGLIAKHAERLHLGAPALSLTHAGDSAVASVVWMTVS